MPLRRLGFARWISSVPSGGNRYDDELVTGLRVLGVDVREHVIPGPWPVVDPAARRGLTELLRSEPDWLIDNILAAGAPEALAAARAAGRRVTVLVHYFPADEIGWSPDERDRLAAAEGQALTAAAGTVATSRWTAGQLRTRYALPGSVVAVPGVRLASPSPAATADRPPRLLWLGRVTRTKDPTTLVTALATLRDLSWTARIIGADTVDPTCTGRLRAAIERSGVADRVVALGPRTGRELTAEWATGQLLVSTSRIEPYGMVVTEALARGIPSVVPAGTGAVEAQRAGLADPAAEPAGATFPIGDPEALAAVLRRWLTDPDQQQRWRHAAATQRSGLPTWRGTAETVLGQLTSASV